MLSFNYTTSGPLTPGLSYATSYLGAFTGLRCTTRARALPGAARKRWLLLGGTSIGLTGIWVAHFITMLVSLLVATVVVDAGLLVVDAGRTRHRSLLRGGLITGLGVACTPYLGFAAMRMPGRISYYPALLVLSIVIAVAAATMALWAALWLRRVWSTLIASLVIGVAVSGMQYTGMAAVRVSRASGPGGILLGGAGGVTAGSFLLPLIIGISIISFLVSASVAWSPTEDEINYDAALLAHVHRRAAASPNVVVAAPHPGRNGRGRAAASRAAAPFPAAPFPAGVHGVPGHSAPPGEDDTETSRSYTSPDLRREPPRATRRRPAGQNPPTWRDNSS